MVCVKEQEDLGEKLSQDEIISQTKQVIQGLEALKQEHHSILEGLLGTLRCLKQDEEGVLVEEKSHMIRKSLEMLELGLSEAQVGSSAEDVPHPPAHECFRMFQAYFRLAVFVISVSRLLTAPSGLENGINAGNKLLKLYVEPEFCLFVCFFCQEFLLFTDGFGSNP